MKVEIDTAVIETIIAEEFALLKTELFESNGRIFGRDWKDLSPSYVPIKRAIAKNGSEYPINVLSGNLLEDLKKAIKISVSPKNGGIEIFISVDTLDIQATSRSGSGRRIAEDVNEEREYISFSEEEKGRLIKALESSSSEWIRYVN